MLAATGFAILGTIENVRNAKFIAGYLVGGLIAASVCYGLFYLFGWIGDQTDHAGQSFAIVGLVFPGIFALAIPFQFARTAVRQVHGF